MGNIKKIIVTKEDDDGDDILFISRNNAKDTECKGELVRFRVIVDGIALFEDKELQKEVFSAELHNKQIVEGYHIVDTFKIIYLKEFKLYISSMDVREIGDDDENKMSFEIEESVIEYYVPSIRKKKKNQKIKINNDIINKLKKPNLSNAFSNDSNHKLQQLHPKK